MPRIWTYRSHLSGDFEIDTDPERLDVERVHRWLSTDTYWALGRDIEKVRRTIAASLVFGVYATSGEQAGVGRLITDGETIGPLTDSHEFMALQGLTDWRDDLDRTGHQADADR